MTEHRTNVRQGTNENLKLTYSAYCNKTCGWEGKSLKNYTLAERDGEDHECYMASIESGPRHG